MTRRLALACSFAFTVVVSFAVATLGVQAGWFGGGTEASPGVAPDQVVTTNSQPTISPSPEVITETIVVDVPVPLPPTASIRQPVTAAPQSFGNPPQQVQQAPAITSAGSSSYRHDDDYHLDDDDHHRRGHDDDDDQDNSGHGRGGDDDDRHGRDDRKHD